jgi:hypothetical protein
VVGGVVAEVGRSDGLGGDGDGRVGRGVAAVVEGSDVLGGDGDDVTLGDSDPKNKLLISLKFNPFPVLL